MKKANLHICICFLIITVLLFETVSLGIRADTIHESDFPSAVDASEASLNVANLPISTIENNAVYALSNVYSGGWASTANTAATVNIHNLFQNSSWTNTAQNFRFVEMSDNTYVIYPLGYNNSNADQSMALYCNCANIESYGQIIENVYPAEYSEEQSVGFEWMVQHEYSEYFTIRLKEYPDYCLTVFSATVGSPTNSGVYDGGNLVAYYVNPVLNPISSVHLWKLKYVIPNGDYYIKNRGDGSYLHTIDQSFAQVRLMNYSGKEEQKWRITHVQNGTYFIGTPLSRMLTIKKYYPEDGEYVYVEDNMAHTRFWWHIDKTISGSFKIQCVTARDYDYALKSGDTIANHHYVESGEYLEDVDYTDEWFIYNKVFGIVHYYDSTIQRNEELLGNIALASEFAINVYENILFNVGIGIEQIGVPQYYFNATGEQALADQCTLPDNFPCETDDDTCGDWCAWDHEKNVCNMADQLFERDKKRNYIYVMWANRRDGTYCNTPFIADDENGDGVDDHVVVNNTIAYVRNIPDNSLTGIDGDYNYPIVNFLTIDQDTDKQNLVLCLSMN